MAVQKRSQLRTRHRAHFLRLDRPVLEQDQRRDAADAELGRRLRILVDVELGDAHAVGVDAGEFIEDRRNHLAGTAPLRPEIEQNGFIGFENVLSERSVAGVDDVRAAHAGKPPVGVN